MEDIENQQVKRLIFFIKNYLKMNLKQFAAELGDSNAQTFYNITKGVHGISQRVVNNISNRFPELNTDWLMTGEGDMIIAENGVLTNRIITFAKKLGISISVLEQKCNIPQGCIEGNEITPEIINNITLTYPSLNPQWLSEGKGDMVVRVYQPSDSAETEYDRLKLEVRRCKMSITDIEQKTKMSPGYISKHPNFNSEIWSKLASVFTPRQMAYIRGESHPATIAAESAIGYTVTKVVDSVEEAEAEVVNPEPTRERHEMNEGTCGLLIPLRLNHYNLKIKDIKPTNIEIGKLMPKFTYFYQVQTPQLEPQISKGDFLMLEPLEVSGLVEGRVYMFNTEQYGVTVRQFRRGATHECELVDINDRNNVMYVNFQDIKEVFDITSALKNTPLLPFHNSIFGRELDTRDQQLKVKDEQIERQFALANKSLEINIEALASMRKHSDTVDLLLKKFVLPDEA